MRDGKREDQNPDRPTDLRRVLAKVGTRGNIERWRFHIYFPLERKSWSMMRCAIIRRRAHNFLSTLSSSKHLRLDRDGPSTTPIYGYRVTDIDWRRHGVVSARTRLSEPISAVIWPFERQGRRGPSRYCRIENSCGLNKSRALAIDPTPQKKRQNEYRIDAGVFFVFFMAKSDAS